MWKRAWGLILLKKPSEGLDKFGSKRNSSRFLVVRGIRSKALATLISQVLSSFSGLLLVSFASKAAGSTGNFAGVAIASTTFVLAQGLLRSILTDSLVSFSELEGAKLSDLIPLGLTLYFFCALTFGGISWLLPPGAIADALRIMALVFLPLMVQDMFRFIAFVSQRPWVAASSDMLRMVSFVVTGFWLEQSSAVSPELVMLCWGISTVPSLLFSLFRMSLIKGWSRLSWQWISSTKPVWPKLLFEWIVSIGVGQGIALLALSITSGREASAFRVASSAMSPVILLMSVMSLGVFGVQRRINLADPRTLPQAAVTSASPSVLAIAYTFTLIVMPLWVGNNIFGVPWATAHDFLMPIGLQYLCSALSIGPMIFLRLSFQPSLVLRTRLIASAPIILCTSFGLSFFGLKGLLWGNALGAAVSLAIWWSTLLNARSRALQSLRESLDSQPQ